MSSFTYIASGAVDPQALVGMRAEDVLAMLDAGGHMHDEVHSTLAFRHANAVMANRVVPAPERVDVDMVQCVVSHGKVKEVIPFHQYVTLTPCVAMSLDGGVDRSECPDMVEFRTYTAHHDYIGQLDLCEY